MKTNKKLFHLLFLLVLSCFVAACGKENVEPEFGDEKKIELVRKLIQQKNPHVDWTGAVPEASSSKTDPAYWNRDHLERLLALSPSAWGSKSLYFPGNYYPYPYSSTAYPYPYYEGMGEWYTDVPGKALGTKSEVRIDYSYTTKGNQWSKYAYVREIIDGKNDPAWSFTFRLPMRNL